jgi:hypothetical protein
MVNILIDAGNEKIENSLKELHLWDVKCFRAQKGENLCETIHKNNCKILLLDETFDFEASLAQLNQAFDQLEGVEIIITTSYEKLCYVLEQKWRYIPEILLKPLKKDKLAFVFQRIVEKAKPIANSAEEYQVQNLWGRVKPILREQFWIDLIVRKLPAHKEAISDAGRSVDLPYLSVCKILPMIAVRKQSNYRPNLIQERSLNQFQNMLAETILGISEDGISCFLTDSVQVVIFCPSEATPELRKKIWYCCDAYQQEVLKQLKYSIYCYVGMPIPVTDLPDMVDDLLALDWSNVLDRGGVKFLDEMNCQVKCATSCRKT